MGFEPWKKNRSKKKTSFFCCLWKLLQTPTHSQQLNRNFYLPVQKRLQEMKEIFLFLLIAEVLRIHETLVRIRICWSMPLTNGFGSGSGSASWSWMPILLFSSLTFKMPTKNYLKKSFSADYFLKVHLHNFSTIKNQRVTKQLQWRFFLLFCMMIEGSGSIPLTNGSRSGSRRPKNIWIRIRNTA